MTSRKHKGGGQHLTKKQEGITTGSLKFESFEGPLPPPEILKKFEEVVEGSAAQIINQANRQTDHRIDMEKRVIKADIIKSYLGLIFGFIIGLGGIGGEFMQLHWDTTYSGQYLVVGH